MQSEREALEEAFRVVHGELDWMPPWNETMRKYREVHSFLDCGAYLDAAVMLVPDGWYVDRASWNDKGAVFGLREAGGNTLVSGLGPTPSAALLEAILKARKSHE